MADEVMSDQWKKAMEKYLNLDAQYTGQPKVVSTANTDAFNQAIQKHYQTAISNQLNNPLPYIKMPPVVANTIEPFKIHVVERYDTDMEVSLILGAFSNREQAEAYAKANGGWEYTVHEFTLDSEVPVEKE